MVLYCSGGEKESLSALSLSEWTDDRLGRYIPDPGSTRFTDDSGLGRHVPEGDEGREDSTNILSKSDTYLLCRTTANAWRYIFSSVFLKANCAEIGMLEVGNRFGGREMIWIGVVCWRSTEAHTIGRREDHQVGMEGRGPPARPTEDDLLDPIEARSSPRMGRRPLLIALPFVRSDPPREGRGPSEVEGNGLDETASTQGFAW